MQTLISLPWRSPARFLFLGIGLVWTWILRHSWMQLLDGRWSLPTDLLAVPFLLVIPATFYLGLADWFNRSTVESDDTWLRVRHSPFPWPSPGPVKLDQLKDLTLVTVTRQRSEKTVAYYNLTAHLKDGKQVVLLKQLPNKQKAKELLAQLRGQLL